MPPSRRYLRSGALRSAVLDRLRCARPYWAGCVALSPNGLAAFALDRVDPGSIGLAASALGRIDLGSWPFCDAAHIDREDSRMIM